MGKKIIQMLIIVGLGLGFVRPGSASLNLDKLSSMDVEQVQNLLAKLEPLIKERESAQSLATLTFDELYAPLNEFEQSFLKEFQNLKGDELGVSIPFRGIATGKEELTVIKDQQVTINDKVTILPPQYLPPNVNEKYLEMVGAMEKDLGKRLFVESGYRSSAYQLYLFIFYLKNHEYSIRETVKWVALPGYSEHGAPQFQAIDFISANGISGEENPQLFEDLQEYHWLFENASRFGFILSYPKGKPGITFEPWHWHYEQSEVDSADGSRPPTPPVH